ncbi:LxmA leader domain family RiPP [Streptomyces sp. NPDC006649]|uniref:LxmA leader domain family RiPP n=1 Tax=Streptomyces sp. NPDC006649 TaxID=3156896 RepID=UPI0033B4D279
MNTADQLISGYTAYTSAEEFGALAEADAPATTPVTVTTVSSGECISFTASLVGTTISGNC